MEFRIENEELNTVYMIDFNGTEFEGSAFPVGIVYSDFGDKELFTCVLEEDHNYYCFGNRVLNKFLLTKAKPGTVLVAREYVGNYRGAYQVKKFIVNAESKIDNPEYKLVLVIGIENAASNNKLLDKIYRSLGR